jgi:hypothetical protein
MLFHVEGMVAAPGRRISCAEALAQEEATHPPSSGVPQVDSSLQPASSNFPLNQSDPATWPSLFSIPNCKFYILQSTFVPLIPLSELLFSLTAELNH